MGNTIRNEYKPELVSAPGDTLLETLETIGMSQAALARRMGRPIKTINEIIQHKAAITPETALQLEHVLRIPASFWINREQHYRESLARFTEKQRLASWIPWLEELPIREMAYRGWMPVCIGQSQQVAASLQFFGVASPDAWRNVWADRAVAHRESTFQPHAGNFGAVAAWLRQGEIEAQEIETAPYNANGMHKAFKHIRKLTIEPVSTFREEIVRECANAGVAVVFVPELPGIGMSCATQWLTPTKALMQLSLRYKTDDHFWFAFFHAAGHLLRHGKRQVFLEVDQQKRTVAEEEADIFAANILIDPIQWQQFVKRNYYHSKAGIEKFAQEVGIVPGIVVGRLQHEGCLPFDHHNELKRRLVWDSEPPVEQKKAL